MNSKTLLVVLALFSCSLLSGYSQTEREIIFVNLEDEPQRDAKHNTYKTTWLKNRFKDTWFVTLGSGVQTIVGEDDHKADFQNRLTYAPTFSIGKYFSPIWGLRLTLSGGSLHGFNDGRAGTYSYWNKVEYHGGNTPTADPVWIHNGWVNLSPDGHGISIPPGSPVYLEGGTEYVWTPGNNGELYMQKIHYLGTNLNFIVDLITLFGNYNPKRVFDITPSGGVGYYHRFANQGNLSASFLGVSAGLAFKFRISSKIDFNLETTGTYLPTAFDGHTGGRMGADGLAQATGSITYKIGKSTWEVAEPMNYEMIRDLNDQINNLQMELDNKVCPECPPPPVIDNSSSNVSAPKNGNSALRFLPEPVFFRINKADIDAAEWSKIEKASEYLSKYPEANIVVTGYADKLTGNPTLNMRLSERRAKAVSNALISKYAVNPLRISINWEGDKIQPFEINEWNRVVVFIIEE